MASEGQSNKWALLSYLTPGVQLSEDDPIFNSHSNLWENHEIFKILLELGYNVDVINWDDDRFIPNKSYDLVIDICYNLARLKPFLRPDTLKLLHCTGSDPFYQNAAEIARVVKVNLDRKSDYSPKRLVEDPELAERSILESDYISLLGNEHTKKTYPEIVHSKITLIPVTNSVLNQNIKQPDDFLPEERQFLWFFGAGAVHKGLDIVLTVFKQHPEYTLNIVGGVAENEPDFITIFSEELFNTPNIHYYGSLVPSSSEFKNILNRSFCFLAPTCSEGISPAVVTCMQIGLYPIISHDTGVDLPKGCGIYLSDLSHATLESSIEHLTHLTDKDTQAQIKQCQTYALINYSRENFSQKMKKYITQCMLDKCIQ